MALKKFRNYVDDEDDYQEDRKRYDKNKRKIQEARRDKRKQKYSYIDNENDD